MNILLKTGKTTVPVDIPDRQLAGILYPNEEKAGLRGRQEVRRSLENPIGTPRLRDMVRPDMRIVIITSDITRPVPSALILPEVLAELDTAGVPRDHITIVFATGSHRGHTEAERRRLVGDGIYDAYRCLDHDPADCVHLGTTPGGTPIDIFRPVAEADFRIGVGNIEYHYFAGYSGGYKAIMPGVSTREAIQANHSRMISPAACAGRLEGNPVREDIESAAALLPLEFIVNVILNAGKEITHCVSGHFIQAHRAGCRYIDMLYKIAVREPADIVIVSPGGYPKDINMYQAQKALDNAKHAVRDGGVIIWVADCTEGFGEKTFEEWMLSPGEEGLIRRIQREFRLGGHKAAVIAMVLERCSIFLVSRMPAELVRQAHLQPFADVESALDAAREKLGPDAKILVMPCGGSTLPQIEQTSV